MKNFIGGPLSGSYWNGLQRACGRVVVSAGGWRSRRARSSALAARAPRAARARRAASSAMRCSSSASRPGCMTASKHTARAGESQLTSTPPSSPPSRDEIDRALARPAGAEGGAARPRRPCCWALRGGWLLGQRRRAARAPAPDRQAGRHRRGGAGLLHAAAQGADRARARRGARRCRASAPCELDFRRASGARRLRLFLFGARRAARSSSATRGACSAPSGPARKRARGAAAAARGAAPIASGRRSPPRHRRRRIAERTTPSGRARSAAAGAGRGAAAARAPSGWQPQGRRRSSADRARAEAAGDKRKLGDLLLAHLPRCRAAPPR